MIAWVAGPAKPHSAITGMPSQNRQPVGARPKMIIPAVPKASPISNARRSPNRFTAGPTNDFQAEGEVTVGNYDALGVTGSVSGPRRKLVLRPIASDRS